MKPLAALVVCGVLVLAASAGKGATVAKPTRTPPYRPERSLELLVPSFRAKVLLLLRALQARGLRPLVWETLRSRERAEALALAGKGVPDSLHIYGLAVDVIDAQQMWSSPLFFRALGEEAELLGLTWGGRFPRVDPPHVQAIPVALQPKLRAASLAEREAILRERYG